MGIANRKVYSTARDAVVVYGTAVTVARMPTMRGCWPLVLATICTIYSIVQQSSVKSSRVYVRNDFL